MLHVVLLIEPVTFAENIYCSENTSEMSLQTFGNLSCMRKRIRTFDQLFTCIWLQLKNYT